MPILFGSAWLNIKFAPLDVRVWNADPRFIYFKKFALKAETYVW
jgi:hypothetical protein